VSIFSFVFFFSSAEKPILLSIPFQNK
jgi:hypothetical protein